MSDMYIHRCYLIITSPQLTQNIITAVVYDIPHGKLDNCMVGAIIVSKTAHILSLVFTGLANNKLLVA